MINIEENQYSRDMGGSRYPHDYSYQPRPTAQTVKIRDGSDIRRGGYPSDDNYVRNRPSRSRSAPRMRSSSRGDGRRDYDQRPSYRPVNYGPRDDPQRSKNLPN